MNDILTQLYFNVVPIRRFLGRGRRWGRGGRGGRRGQGDKEK